MNNIDIYEQMLLDEFRHNILEGRFSVSELRQMVEEGKATDNQIQVIEELAPVLGGLGNMVRKGAQAVGQGARAVGQGVKQAAQSVGQGVQRSAQAVGQGVQQAAQGMKNSYQQGVQQATNQNAFNQLVKLYDGQFAKALQAVAAATPNNPDISDAVTNVDLWMKHLGKLVYGSKQVR